ncbi:hypothetical protein AWW66_16945 [Micromonospora rosaria]|uniref:PBS lyase n=1 Tax=Micromonospora rosaria TaxID=47874 RepID=A0A136PR43_9ACTN|nr:hypothetical protein [Micromonospora rosaria]KXK60814.1 hypothetical protein AWW66_16945 [Micromonospora rosaria]
MLDGLDTVDWPRLGHAYGSAGDVPDQIRALRSPDPEVRERALGALYSNIFHQGTRYEASAYAVPFLLELLAHPDTPEPEWVLALLTSLAVGYDESFLPDGVPVAEYRRAAEGGRELLAAKPPPWTGDNEDEKEYVEYLYVESLTEADQNRLWAYVGLATYDAVRAGVPLFRTLLDHPDPGVRVGAAYALAWFPEEAAGSLPALAAVAAPAGGPDGGADGLVREPAEVATAVVAAGLLGAAPEVEMLADPRPLVRWAAAVARARVLGAQADPATVDELLTWTTAASIPSSPPSPTGSVAGSAEAASAGSAAGSAETVSGGVGGRATIEEEMPFLSGDLGGYAGLALRQLGPGHEDRAFDALLVRLSAVTGIEALTVVTEALRLAFPDGPLAGTPAAELPPRQRRLVEVLARSPEAWLFDGSLFGNVASLFTDHGLPGTRQGMLDYLANQPPSPHPAAR